MQTEDTRKAVANALRSFRIAENEINRPNEDAVLLCACYTTRISISRFLQSYLQSTSPGNREDNMHQLLDECIRLDRQFSKIDLSCFNCGETGTECNNQYCLSGEKVSECYTRARDVKDLVLEKLNLSEKDFDV
jgi:hypothetical protein